MQMVTRVPDQGRRFQSVFPLTRGDRGKEVAKMKVDIYVRVIYLRERGHIPRRDI